MFLAGVGLAIGGLTYPRVSHASDLDSLSLPIGSVYIRAMDIGIDAIVAATGDATEQPTGLYRTSLDLAAGWEPLGFEDRFIASVQVFGSQDEGVVVVAGNPPEILLSTDGGQSWDSKAIGNSQFFFWHVRLHRDRPEVWYASYKDNALNRAGMMTSTDYGETWSTFTVCVGCATSGFLATEIANTDPTRAVGAHFSGFFESSLYRTTDTGGSWSLNQSHPYNSVAPIDLTYEEFPSSRTVQVGSRWYLVWENWVFQGFFWVDNNYGDIGMETPRWDPGAMYLAWSTAGTNQPMGGDLRVQRTLDPTVDDPWDEVVGLEDGTFASPNNDTHRWRFEAAPEAPVFILSAPNHPMYRIDVGGTVGVDDQEQNLSLIDAPWTVLGSPGADPILRFEAGPRREVGLQVVDVSGAEVARRLVTLGGAGSPLQVRDLVGGRSGVYWIRAVGGGQRSVAATKVHVIR